MTKGMTKEAQNAYTAEDLRSAGTIKGIPECEIETVITYGRKGEMQIYTCDNRVLTKLKKLVDDEIWKVKKIERNAEGELRGVFVTAPQRMLSFRKKIVTRTARAKESGADETEGEENVLECGEEGEFGQEE